MSNESLPLVSIIVPVFNGERYLRESLDSILAQTYPRTEVLVMDDASTDASPEIIASFGDRVKYYRQPENRGQFQNINDGIAMAGGDFVAIYHADDVYNPAIVEREVAFFERHPEAGAVFCYDIFINAEGREYGRLTIPQELRSRPYLTYPTIINALLTYKNVFMPTPGGMVRASMYREVGTYRGAEFRIASDLEMWLRIARKHPIGILEEYLFSYRHGHGNLSQLYYHVRTEEERHFQILDMHLADGGRELATPEAMQAYEAHRAEDRLMVAINHYILGKNKEARVFLSKIKASHILGSPRVQRMPLLILLIVLRIFVHLPRLSVIAAIFYRRWHVPKYAA